MQVHAMKTNTTDYKVADIGLADFGRKEISLAEVPEAGRQIVEGQVRGRIVVKIG